MFALLLPFLLGATPSTSVADLDAGAQLSFARDQGKTPHSRVFDLSTKHQGPKVLVFSCSDSRLDPQYIFNLLPGDCYNMRNPGNIVGARNAQVPAAAGAMAATDQIVASALEMGVDIIAVMGHTECSTIEPLANGAHSSTSWSAAAGPLADRIADNYGALTAAQKIAAAIAENTRQQRERLLERKDVREALRSGALRSVEAYIYEMGPKERGTLSRWSEKDRQFVVIAGRLSELPKPMK